jgi:hypothetical protein
MSVKVFRPSYHVLGDGSSADLDTTCPTRRGFAAHPVWLGAAYLSNQVANLATTDRRLGLKRQSQNKRNP